MRRARTSSRLFNQNVKVEKCEAEHVCVNSSTESLLIAIVMMSFMNFMSYPRISLATVVPFCAREHTAHNAEETTVGSGVGVLM